MKKALLNVFLILYFPILLIAQFQKGVIFLQSGEPVSGYIDQEPEVALKQRVHFKTSLGATKYETYSPNQIAGFSYDKGSSFESIETYFKKEQIVFKERSFAKVVATGVIDLYLSQLDIEESEFVFYARKSGRLHRMSQERIDISPYGYIIKNYYLGVLNALTFDCRTRIGNVDEVPFKREQIVRIIHNYNACQDPSYKPLKNTYQVAKEKRYFLEFFGGPLISKRDFGALTGMERNVLKEVFASVGVAAQVDVYKPSLSRNLLIHNSLEAYKWIAVEESGVIEAPVLSMAFTMAAHYMLNERDRVKVFTRLGASFVVDFGSTILPRPGISVGLGTYFPSGSRLSLQLSSLSLLGSEGITAWRLAYAFPLAVIQK